MKKLVKEIKESFAYLRENPDERALILSDFCLLVAAFVMAVGALYVALEVYGGK